VARELTYLDFDVLLERVGKSRRRYRARVVNAPAGQTPPVAFTMPFTPQDLEIFVLRIGRPRRVVRRIDAPETAAVKIFGGQLYRALFHDQLEVNLLRSLSEAAAKGAGLRIRLRLSDTPELAELPWEFLYDQTRNRFLSLSDRTPLVRYLEVSDPPRPLTVSPPLQILVMIASPSDYPQLDVEQEWTKLRTALAPLEQANQVQVTRLETATLAALRRQLRRADWHVLHFIGHGGFDPQTQDGVLVLEDQTGRSRLVSGQDLGVLVHDHDPLRLVVLNACEGARADPNDPFAGTAQSLIQQGIPAVVAMQFEITDPAAIGFASELYTAVADGYPLDAALAEARKAIWADGNQVEWATPVLHLRAPDGRIFNVAPTPATAPIPPRPARKAATSVSPHPPSKAATPPRPASKAATPPRPASKAATPPRPASKAARNEAAAGPELLGPREVLSRREPQGPSETSATGDVNRAQLKRLVRLGGPDSWYRCQICGNGVKGSNIVHHLDQEHARQLASARAAADLVTRIPAPPASKVRSSSLGTKETSRPDQAATPAVPPSSLRQRLASAFRGSNRPSEQVTRDDVKQLARSGNAEDLFPCPICNAPTKLKNLVHHFDTNHGGQSY
jgi:hypothetical protein